MDHTYVDEKNLKNLEDLSVFLSTAMITLITLHNAQVRSIEIGIMQEDMNKRANTIVWEIARLMKLYKDQLESVFELLPDNFNAIQTIKNLQKAHMKKARALTRKPKEKKCAT